MWNELRRFHRTFNSGVLLTELQFWQDEAYDKLSVTIQGGAETRIPSWPPEQLQLSYYLMLDAKHNYQLYELGDETVFNLIFKESYIPLPKSWNCCGFGNHPWITRWLPCDLSQVKILHWNGGHRKPWNSPDVVFSELWSSYAPPHAPSKSLNCYTLAETRTRTTHKIRLATPSTSYL